MSASGSIGSGDRERAHRIVKRFTEIAAKREQPVVNIRAHSLALSSGDLTRPAILQNGQRGATEPENGDEHPFGDSAPTGLHTLMLGRVRTLILLRRGGHLISAA